MSKVINKANPLVVKYDVISLTSPRYQRCLERSSSSSKAATKGGDGGGSSCWWAAVAGSEMGPELGKKAAHRECVVATPQWRYHFFSFSLSFSTMTDAAVLTPPKLPQGVKKPNDEEHKKALDEINARIDKLKKQMVKWS